MSGVFEREPRGRLSRLREDSVFVRHYLWKYRKWAAIGLLALALINVLEALPPLYMKQAVDAAMDHSPWSRLAEIAGACLFVAILQAIGRYGWRMYLIRASMYAGRDLRDLYVRQLFRLSVSFFDRHRIGDLMSLATSDTEAVRMMIGAGVLVFFDALFYFLTVPVVMWSLSPRLTVLALAPLLAIPFIVARNERQIHLRYEKVQDCLSRLSALVQESLAGIRVTRAFAREDVQVRRLAELGAEYRRLHLRLARIQTSFGPSMDFVMSLGLVLLLYIGGGDLIHGRAEGGWGGAALTLGTFVAFQRYIQKMIAPMSSLGMAVAFYQRSATSTRRIRAVLEESSDVPDIAEPELPAGAPCDPVERRVTGWKTAGKLEFRRLSFAFPGALDQVLSDVTLEIAAGERVAFVGTIGSGKSALLSLLPRIYPVASGMLFVDGVDINCWPGEELRNQVGYVSQDVFLFSETVLENVAFGLHGWAEGGGTRDAMATQAARLASVHDEVLGLEAAYGTRLGERGINLSGGQKQRLTIARALAKQPSILVLDDALSAVDVQTEERILEGLRSRAGRKTEIVAAHRISTIRDADRIVVLERGRITAVGTHAELIRARAGIYWMFYEQQRLREDLDGYAEDLAAKLKREGVTV